MRLKLNKLVMFSLVSELLDATTRSGKSRDKILRDLANSHPEITYTPDEWEHIPDDTKEKILDRIRKTLNAVS